MKKIDVFSSCKSVFISKIDDYIVLKSELESTYLDVLSRGQRLSGNTKCAVLKNLITNKLLVARYPAMDWDGNGIISGDNEMAHSDSWYKAIFTSWLDDWYYGGDINLCEGPCLQELYSVRIGYDNDDLQSHVFLLTKI